MNDGKIIIDKIIAEAEEAAKAIIAKGQQEADAILKAAQDKVHKDEKGVCDPVQVQHALYPIH